jgi:hypothetical protein
MIGLFPPNQLAVREAWHAFQLFLSIPTVGPDGGASFQSEIVDEGETTAQIRFVRQVGAPDGSYAEAVAIEFSIATFPSDFNKMDVWSQDFDDLGAFVGHVEQLAEFQFALEAMPQHALLCMAETD